LLLLTCDPKSARTIWHVAKEHATIDVSTTPLRNRGLAGLKNPDITTSISTALYYTTTTTTINTTTIITITITTTTTINQNYADPNPEEKFTNNHTTTVDITICAIRHVRCQSG